MEALTLHPQNKAQLDAIKAIARALKVPFNRAEEKTRNPSPSNDKWFSNPENMDIAEKAVVDFKANPKVGTRLNKSDINNLLGL